MKTYDLTKFGKKDLLLKMSEFVRTLINNGDVCEDETKDFLKLYFEYILRLNNMTSEELKCTFHPTTKMDEGEVAYMISETSEISDVYLNKKYFKLNFKDRMSAVFKFAYLLTDGGHEIEHVLQNSRGRIASDRVAKEELIQSYYDEYHNYKNRKKFKKVVNKQIDCLGTLHKSELEAEEKGINYAITLLKELIKLNSNADYINYLLDVIDSVKEEIEEDIKSITAHENKHKKVNKFLSNFGISVDC